MGGAAKICFKCKKNLPLSEFYKHPQMADGHLNKCKECAKNDARGNNHVNRDRIAKYEKQRNLHPQRRLAKAEAQRQHRLKYPERFKARNAVSNAVRDRRLEKLPCRDCGSLKSQAHHTDYSKPLDVIWLCRSCHIIAHDKVPYPQEEAT